MRDRHSKGFTLIELLIVVAIIGLVFSMSFSLFGFVSRVLNKGEDQSSVQQSVRMASMYISNEVRTAKDVTILENLPAEADMGLYNYIYVDGSTIKHRNVNGTEIVDIMKHGINDLQPSLLFDIATEETILEFNVSAILDGQSYNIASEITPLNLVGPDKVQIESAIESTGGSVLRYSDPIADDNAIIRIDTLLLDLLKSNAFLELNGEFLELEPPTIDPNFIYLPTSGSLGSTITWSSNSTYIKSNGVVFRPASDAFNQDVILTATISKGSGTSLTKTYKIKVMKLEPFIFDTSSLSININANEAIVHPIVVEGGDPGYDFISPELNADIAGSPTYNLSLDKFGVLTGTVTESVTFTVFASDNNIDMNTEELQPNTIGPATFTITVP